MQHMVNIARGESAGAALKIVAASLVARIRANRHGVIDAADSEYLHQMRVSIRRLRSLFSVYEKVLPNAALQSRVAGLKWLAHVLGPARDADVFVAEIWPPLYEALPAGRLLNQLAAVWAVRRDAALAKARRVLGSRRHERFLSNLEHWLAGDALYAGATRQQLAVLNGHASDLARRVIKRRDAKVREHGHTLKGADDTELHALRIRIKKLRYAIDGFASLFDKGAVQKMTCCLSRLQELLGALNDLRIAEQQVTEVLADIRERGLGIRKIRAATAAWREARDAALRRKLRGAWRDYRHAKRFW